jgi:hypothetical protein
MKRKLFTVIVLAMVLLMVLIVPIGAQSTTKQLSTNFTLVNLSSDQEAKGFVHYYKPDGSSWRADDTFTLAKNGGQIQYRQYFDSALTAGQGAVVVEADQALGSVVQIQARNQNPASYGAYAGVTTIDSKYYVPLAARKKSTLSGMANSQIVVQNGSPTDPVNYAIDLVNSTGAVIYSKTGSIAANGSYMYDLALESSTNVPDNWIGSAVVRATSAGGQVAVVSNFFTGDALQTFNAFPSSAPGMTWYVPQFNSRMSNTLSSVVTVQNLSGANIAANAITLACKPIATGSDFSVKNPAILGDSASYSFNPAADTVGMYPDRFEGACTLTAPANVVVFVQLRFISSGEAGAYEAFRPGTDTKLIVPLVAKRLNNGFSSVVTIQNIGTDVAHVTLNYTPSATECVGCAPASFTREIPVGGNLMQNHGIVSGNNSVPELTAPWQGSLVVTSDQPIVGFVQLRFRRDINPALPGGDLYMAHDAFTQP